MDYQEAVTILNSFTTHYANLASDPNVIQISFEQSETEELFFNVVVSQSYDVNNFRSLYSIDDVFELNGRDDVKSSYKININTGGEIVSHSAMAGTEAKHVKLSGYGTYGWGFMLNGYAMALSNWHVLCPLGNSTQPGERVKIDGQDIAALYSYEPVGDMASNLWDMAIAKFDNVDDMLLAFRPCGGVSNNKPYPMQVQTAKVVFGTPAYKVGARYPICRNGTLVGIANVRVLYNDNVIRPFINQLVFKKMTDP